MTDTAIQEYVELKKKRDELQDSRSICIQELDELQEHLDSIDQELETIKNSMREILAILQEDLMDEFIEVDMVSSLNGSAISAVEEVEEVDD